MKSEHTEVPPRFNLLKPDGIRAQGAARDVTHILLNNGQTYSLEPNSFKFYRVNDKVGVPYVTFVVSEDEANYSLHGARLAGKRMEVFPASITGIVYDDDGAADAVTEVTEGVES